GPGPQPDVRCARGEDHADLGTGHARDRWPGRRRRARRPGAPRPDARGEAVRRLRARRRARPEPSGRPAHRTLEPGPRGARPPGARAAREGLKGAAVADAVTYETDDRVARIVLDDGKVNAMAPPFFAAFNAALD